MNIEIFSILFCLVILIYACQSDIRKRLVSNFPWIIMTVLGIGILTVGAILSGPHLLIPAAVSILITAVLSFLFFQFSLFGAADAKCLIGMAFVFPAYPALVMAPLHFPLYTSQASGLFPFPLTTLLNASLISMLVPVLLFIRNLVDLGFRESLRRPGMVFTGYRVPVARLAQTKHVRLVHPSISDGNGRPRKRSFGGIEIDEDTIRQLQAHQREGKLGNEVWVTPELPFIVFITAGFLVAVVVGNPIFALLSLV